MTSDNDATSGCPIRQPGPMNDAHRACRTAAALLEAASSRSGARPHDVLTGLSAADAALAAGALASVIVKVDADGLVDALLDLLGWSALVADPSEAVDRGLDQLRRNGAL